MEFDRFVLNITQSFYQNTKAYDFDTLTLAILNESKRYKHKNQANTVTNPSEKSNSDKKDQNSKNLKNSKNSNRVNKKP